MAAASRNSRTFQGFDIADLATSRRLKALPKRTVEWESTPLSGGSFPRITAQVAAAAKCWQVPVEQVFVKAEGWGDWGGCRMYASARVTETDASLAQRTKKVIAFNEARVAYFEQRDAARATERAAEKEKQAKERAEEKAMRAAARSAAEKQVREELAEQLRRDARFVAKVTNELCEDEDFVATMRALAGTRKSAATPPKAKG